MLRLPRLYPILDTAALARRGCTVAGAASALLSAGAMFLQIRHKAHWTRKFFHEAEIVAEMCGRHKAALIINDRADFALLLNAGLHVGQDDVPVAAARGLIGPERILGFSTHNAEQLQAAANESIDYVAVGPIFLTASKDQPDPQVGLEKLREWRDLVSVHSLVAIGGITRANAQEVLGAGADSLAVIGDLLPEICTELTLGRRFEEWQSLLVR